MAIAALAFAPQASASFRAVYADYKGDSAITPCRHSESSLRAAQRQIPSDIDQYAPGFEEQLVAALESHARGDCDADEKSREDEDDAGKRDEEDTAAARGDDSEGATGGEERADAGVPEPPTPAVEAAAPPGPAPTVDTASDGSIDLPWPIQALALLSAVAALAAGAAALRRRRSPAGEPRTAVTDEIPAVADPATPPVRGRLRLGRSSGA